jgi:hypothetical protein
MAYGQLTIVQRLKGLFQAGRPGEPFMVLAGDARCTIARSRAALRGSLDARARVLQAC